MEDWLGEGWNDGDLFNYEIKMVGIDGFPARLAYGV